MCQSVHSLYGKLNHRSGHTADRRSHRRGHCKHTRKKTDPLGHVTSTVYDALNRRIQIILTASKDR